MYALSIATLVLLSAAVTAPAAGYVVPRKETPSTYAVGYLEDYQTYHARYLAIRCQYQHNNATFFNACCHPMLATETLETARPSSCIPSTSASSSASAAEATSTVTTPADEDNGDDNDDCDDGDDDESTTSSVVFTSSATPSSTSEISSTFSSTFSEPTTSPESTPTPTSTQDVQTTSSSSVQSTPTSGSVDASSGSSQVFTGGHATYYDQNGVAATAHYGSGDGSISQYCGQTVTIIGLGKTMQATVADECPTCDNNNDLDMSVALFQSFTDLSVGEFYISWLFD
ncbi:hypothetical protein J3R30DRAFT_3695549 [Lentinula aciculospora]|uniref:RlpA-like protein double-psi beta-barrel domain-containing protein n=1 Tax=Lentinula aciculospora TaxID=153920 RepID=A0A9W9DV36_9AGAR|nr:hypothetical protein J3R30DRAFT_3695549 [Lentinula aciculospora]